jgi:hypothetical protein
VVVVAGLGIVGVVVDSGIVGVVVDSGTVGVEVVVETVVGVVAGLGTVGVVVDLVAVEHLVHEAHVPEVSQPLKAKRPLLIKRWVFFTTATIAI